MTIDEQSLALAVAAGTNAVTAVREAMGYSIDDLAVTCGLAIEEILELENSNTTDVAKLRRIATAFGLPEIALITSSVHERTRTSPLG